MTPGLVLGLCRNIYCQRSWILLLLVFNQIFLSLYFHHHHHIIITIIIIIITTTTTDITCCSLHIAPGLKGI